MKFLPVLVAASAVCSASLAENTRELDAHEHGVGQLDIAVEGTKIAMEFHAPGADIVGFEYQAKSEKDLAAIDAAIALLEKPETLFAMSSAAGCQVVSAAAELETENGHDDHKDHDHDEHKDDNHDDHKDDDHDDHDDHKDETGHTEFHAEYVLDCADPSAITEMSFEYFASYPNAVEVDVQIITDDGASAFEVDRNAPNLDLSGMF